MTKAKAPATNPKALVIERTPDQTPAQATARAALMPSINSASVIEAYQGNIIGKDVGIGGLIDGLRDTFKQVNDSDLSNLEAMLIGQATVLQTIFTSLARRAANQEHLRQYEAFLGLRVPTQQAVRGRTPGRDGHTQQHRVQGPATEPNRASSG